MHVCLMVVELNLRHVLPRLWLQDAQQRAAISKGAVPASSNLPLAGTACRLHGVLANRQCKPHQQSCHLRSVGFAGALARQLRQAHCTWWQGCLVFELHLQVLAPGTEVGCSEDYLIRVWSELAVSSCKNLFLGADTAALDRLLAIPAALPCLARSTLALLPSATRRGSERRLQGGSQLSATRRSQDRATAAPVSTAHVSQQRTPQQAVLPLYDSDDAG